MTGNDLNSRAPKSRSDEPEYWSYETASEPVRRLIDAEAEIARELGLNESLRSRLSHCVTSYIRDVREASERPRVLQSKVHRRFKSIRKAASKLRKFFTESPKADKARVSLKDFENSGYGFAAVDPNWKQTLGDERLRGLQEATASFYGQLNRNSVWVDGRDVLFHSPIDSNGLCKALDQLCEFIDKQEKGTGGRPASEAWDNLMLQLAAIYEAATGKEATVTENEHRAEQGERYSGPFIRIASLIDHTTADYCKTEAHPNSALGPEAHPNSALGPALRRLLKSRKNPRSKTC